jgi:hypothetical protein
MRGGARPGAGRKEGSKTRRTTAATRRIAERAVSDGGALPLDVLLSRMRRLWGDGKACDEDQREACELAKHAAPYIHPRLQSVSATVENDLRTLSDEELNRQLASLLGVVDLNEDDMSQILSGTIQ